MIAAGVLGGASLALAATGWTLGRAFSGPHYRGPPSDHFDGRRFHNLVEQEQHGFGAFLRWKLEGKRGPWREPFAAEPGPPPPRRVGAGEVRVTFVGHATLLVQMDGLNVLTDPIWSERASPVSFAGPRRVRPPGLRFEDLPPIDVVLVSHNHYDHLDAKSIEALAPRCRFLCPLGLGDFVRLRGARDVTELDWWQSAEIGGTTFTLLPAQHWSRRLGMGWNETLWGSWLIERDGRRVYFGGDSGYFKGYRVFGRRFPGIDVALIGVGAFAPRWFMHYAHMDVPETVRAFRELGARYLVPTQSGVLGLGDEPASRPQLELERAAAADPWLRERLRVLPVGGRLFLD